MTLRSGTHTAPSAITAPSLPLPAATMGLKEDFEKAAVEAKTLPSNTSNEDQLVLYALYKQALVGDNTTSKPGLLDFKGKAKWEAWENQKGKSKETAMEEYIMKVAELKEKYGVA